MLRVYKTSLYHTAINGFIYDLLSAALNANKGNKIKTAKHLGIARSNLYKLIRQYDIQVPNESELDRRRSRTL